MISLIGKKLGMTCIYTDDGYLIPVTVIKIKNSYIIRIVDNGSVSKNIQVAYSNKDKNCISKAELGHFIRLGVKVGCKIWEFSTENNIFSINQDLNVSIFKNIKKVDVTGISKGKGFAGTVKRWNFRTQDATHGNSLSHRVPGSIGQNQTPGRVFKGKKMAGQMGNKRVTIQNLNIVRIDFNRNILIIKGSIPGPKNQDLIVRPSIKNK